MMQIKFILRQALVSETSVNIIASVTYYYFVSHLYSNKLALENLTPIRYLDWVFTTPLLLLSFVLITNYSSSEGETIDLEPLIYIIILNMGMLLFGFLGEKGIMNFWNAFFLGAGCYAGLMYLLYDKYVKNEDEGSKILYGVFVAIWGLYGVSYHLPIRKKNIAYNILDLVSKAGFGVYIWLKLITESPQQYASVRSVP